MKREPTFKPDITTTPTMQLPMGRKPTPLRKTSGINVNKLVEDVFEQLDTLFMLTSELQLPVDKAREIIREIAETVASSYSSKPTAEAIVKKIKRNIHVFNEYIVSKLLKELDKLTHKQLEYIVTRGGKAILQDAERLYKIAIKENREDLIDIVRSVWNTNGPRSLLDCPKCGFKSITPERYCLICGATVTDDYIRKLLEFEDKFIIYLKTASIAELNEVLQHGYVLVGEKGVYNPRSKRARLENPVLYMIYLRKNEISRIIEEINSRELPI
ncbi:MAG: hypothetical protein QXE81_01305 [Desulfurococcaceae archaeon]